jgi:tRNA nucleotidyltransferase (CCA-adding enzyme)
MVELAGKDAVIVMGGDSSMNELFVQPDVASLADLRGRTGFAEREYPQAEYLARALAAAQATQLDPAERAALDGAAIGARLREARLAALQRLHAMRPQ